jgi:hypothetical protein
LQLCLVKTEPDSGLIFGTRFSNFFKEQELNPNQHLSFSKELEPKLDPGVLTPKKGWKKKDYN